MAAEMKISTPVPLTILAGFLGSGKTTLLNHLLHANHGLRVAVLVNDFGAINIDTQLVVGVQGDTVSLSNGCICCTIRGDLLKATMDLLTRSEPPEYIIVETSGVSDPLEVAMTFTSPQLRQRLSVDSILTVIDSEQVRDLKQEYEVLAFLQVAQADIVVLNKVDLVDDTQREAVKNWIREITPQARILETCYGQVPLELVLGVGHFESERLATQNTKEVHVHPVGETSDTDHDHSEHTDHSLVFSTWSWETDQPLLLKTLRKAIEKLPTTIFRAKGIVYLADSPERRGVLQVVGTRVSLTMGDPWGEQTPRSQIVVIGTYSGVPADILTALFEQTLASNAPPSEIERITNTIMGWLRRKP